MATVKEVKKTAAYRALAPYIVKQDRSRFAKALAAAPIHADLSSADSLDGLFLWDSHPYGLAWWKELHMSLLNSGAYEELGVKPFVGIR